MAQILWDPLIEPLRGKDQGAVFQTNPNGDILLSKNSGKNTDSQTQADARARFQHAASLWRDLSPGEKANWLAASTSFPTVDRYGNPLLSYGFQLFMRAIASLPIADQFAQATPAAAYLGPTPVDPVLSYASGVLTFSAPAPPPGDTFRTQLFASVCSPITRARPNTSPRLIYDSGPQTVALSEDVTAEYLASFGQLPKPSFIFWATKIYLQDTPEIVMQKEAILYVNDPIITFEMTLVFDWGARVSLALEPYLGRIYTVIDAQFRWVELDFVTSGASTDNPEGKLILSLSSGRNRSLNKIFDSLIFSSRRATPGAGGVNVFRFDGTTWTIVYQWGSGTNGIVQNIEIGGEYWMIASEIARLYDLTWTLTGTVARNGVSYGTTYQSSPDLFRTTSTAPSRSQNRIASVWTEIDPAFTLLSSYVVQDDLTGLVYAFRPGPELHSWDGSAWNFVFDLSMFTNIIRFDPYIWNGYYIFGNIVSGSQMNLRALRLSDLTLFNLGVIPQPSTTTLRCGFGTGPDGALYCNVYFSSLTNTFTYRIATLS